MGHLLPKKDTIKGLAKNKSSQAGREYHTQDVLFS